MEKGKPAIEGGTPVRPASEYLVFGQPVIGKEEIAEVQDVFDAKWLGTGPRVRRFENAFAQYIGMPHTVAVNSCTAALHLALLAAGIGQGDEVITTPMTFCATVNAILHAGAVPVLADCRRDTMNLDPAQVCLKLTDRTRALLPVHFAGRCCAMDKIMDIAGSRGLKVIEDCAHAVETTFGGRHAGTFGDLGCFSFYSTKNITTGEGGMVCTRSAEMADRVKRLALHGMSHDAWKRHSDAGFRHYDVVDLGFKYNMMDLQAALGIHQLARIETQWERRRVIWNTYLDAFRDLPCMLPAAASPDEKHACHLFTLSVDTDFCRHSRDWVMQALHAEGIGTGVHYRAVFEHPYYRERFGWEAKDYPNAAFIGARTLSLPLSPGMSDRDVEDVIRAVHKVLA